MNDAHVITCLPCHHLPAALITVSRCASSSCAHPLPLTQINYLVSACQLMVQAKRQQLKVEAMRRRKAAEAAVGGGVPTSTKKGTAAATPASHKKRQ